jgi:hypothetical protein
MLVLWFELTARIEAAYSLTKPLRVGQSVPSRKYLRPAAASYIMAHQTSLSFDEDLQ